MSWNSKYRKGNTSGIFARRSKDSGSRRHFQMFKHIPRKNHQGSQAPSQTLQARTIAQSADSIELDFKKCFDNIPLDKAIGCIKEMEIKNFQLLRTIKHLTWTSKEYSGVGLSQGTVLGPLLANCYLTRLDTFIEQTFETKKMIQPTQRITDAIKMESSTRQENPLQILPLCRRYFHHLQKRRRAKIYSRNCQQLY